MTAKISFRSSLQLTAQYGDTVLYILFRMQSGQLRLNMRSILEHREWEKLTNWGPPLPWGANSSPSVILLGYPASPPDLQPNFLVSVFLNLYSLYFSPAYMSLYFHSFKVSQFSKLYSPYFSLLKSLFFPKGYSLYLS